MPHPDAIQGPLVFASQGHLHLERTGTRMMAGQYSRDCGFTRRWGHRWMRQSLPR